MHIEPIMSLSCEVLYYEYTVNVLQYDSICVGRNVQCKLVTFVASNFYEGQSVRIKIIFVYKNFEFTVLRNCDVLAWYCY